MQRQETVCVVYTQLSTGQTGTTLIHNWKLLLHWELATFLCVQASITT